MRQPSLAALVAAATLLVPAALVAQAGRPIGDAAYDSTFFAWERGDYPDALRRLDRLLSGPQAARYVAPAAELTGELFTTTELTTDGRGVRWSPDSRYVAYERGQGAQRRTHVVAMDGGAPRSAAILEGVGLVFDVRGRAAYISGSPAGVVVRDLATGEERWLNTTGLAVQSLTVGRHDNRIYALAPTGSGASDLHLLGETAPQRVTRGAGTKTAPVVLASGRIAYGVDRQTFAVEDPASAALRQHSGFGFNVSADGGTLVYAWRDGADHVISVMDAPTLESREVIRTTDALSSPSLSHDGRLVTYQRIPREDWEVYVSGADGADERRLTREIQHDVLPRFVDDGRVVALMGEPRHRRSYLYDIATGTRTRLFHNNTVRTVAPEYEWELSPDGTKLAIVAERDGDTVSPERGVYVMDLTRRVTLDEVRERVRQQLAHEDALRQRGARLFAGLEEPVAAAVADVSKDRVYRYSYDLYQFDSKYITEPGNRLAIEYLVGQLQQWGYEPEVQWFETRPRAAPGTQPQVVRTANVIATLRGTTHPDVLYVVSSHFDSVERGPGADDNTSGTAALLEAARVLATRPQAATIHFAFFTGEESGLLGSREYVRRAVEAGDRLVGALNNDMIGFANDQRLDNTIRYSNAGIRDIQHAAAFLFTDLITYDAKYYRGTDAHAYYETYGDIVGGIGSYPILGNPHYHQTHDQLETINHQLVAEVSKTTVATLMKLANVPSRPTGVIAERRNGRTEVRWDTLPESDVVEYVVEWGPAGDAARGAARVREPHALLADVAPGEEIRVGAVNARGAHSWDVARVVVEAAPSQ
jgi:hypothetical protein